MKPYVPIKWPNEKLIDKAELFNDTMNASMRIATYNEKLKTSRVRSELLLEFLTMKEALESSKIEGTQATFDEILEYKSNNNNSNGDIQEIVNYYSALERGVAKLNSLPISSRLLKELHRILLSNGVRGGHKTPGEFRTVQNFIGEENCSINNATYIPPEPQLVDLYMSNLDEYINNNTNEENDLIKIAIIHSQFETIHPFLDGNGRIGRILIPLYLYERKVVNGANLFISSSLEKDKYKYYRLLNNTRQILNEDDPKSVENVRHHYTAWIKFFLNACIQELDKIIDKIDKINELYEITVTRAKGIVESTKMVSLIDKIFEFPVFNTKNITGIDIAQSTLNNYLKKLVEAGILDTDSKQRGKTYYFYDLIGLLR